MTNKQVIIITAEAAQLGGNLKLQTYVKNREKLYTA